MGVPSGVLKSRASWASTIPRNARARPPSTGAMRRPEAIQSLPAGSRRASPNSATSAITTAAVIRITLRCSHAEAPARSSHAGSIQAQLNSASPSAASANVEHCQPSRSRPRAWEAMRIAAAIKVPVAKGPAILPEIQARPGRMIPSTPKSIEIHAPSPTARPATAACASECQLLCQLLRRRSDEAGIRNALPTGPIRGTSQPTRAARSTKPANS
jgi:hypothetical protein